MEKLPHQIQKQNHHQFSETKSELSSLFSNRKLWDCGSTLYDSFELNSFKSQLNSAIIVANNNNSYYYSTTRRTLSMSHLPETRVLQLQPLAPVEVIPPKKHSFNISRSFQKFIRSIFKYSSNNNKSTTVSSTTTTSSSSSSISFQVPEKYSSERVYVVYEKSGPVLTTIPEVPEFEINGGAISPPDISSLVRSASERITSTTAVGISCT